MFIIDSCREQQCEKPTLDRKFENEI
jgi:hypothetical protein